MSRKLSVKLVLAGLWLLCYLPYKEALLVGEDNRVSSLLGGSQNSDNAKVFDLRHQDLTIRDSDDIHIFSWIKFDAADPEDSQFNEGLANLDVAGHEIMHQEDGFGRTTKEEMSYPVRMTSQQSHLKPPAVSREGCCPQLSTPAKLLKSKIPVPYLTIRSLYHGDPNLGLASLSTF